MYYSQSGEFSLIYIRRRLSTDENLPYYIKRTGKNGWRKPKFIISQ